MIIDKLKNWQLYKGINPRIDQGLEYLANNDFSNFEVGTIEVDGNKLFLINQEFDTKPIEEGRWETHRKYIDIHYVIEGVETIVYGDPDSLVPTTDYDPETDKIRYTGEGQPVTLRAGMFMICFPEDAHKACVYHKEGPHHVKKAVVKVLI